MDTLGRLAQTPHPAGLGSPLTHPNITTDFSEALCEFITPTFATIDAALHDLDNIHRFVYTQLNDEMLWSASMPCVLGDDRMIPVAQYGHSNVAQMKTTYRYGLSHRYGRHMQMIAGIHYNFSLPMALWQFLQDYEANQDSLQDYVTSRYFHLIRNFRRYAWLWIYCYGASPVVDSSFFGTGDNKRDHMLLEWDNHSLYLPYATALRISDIGYQSAAQERLYVDYNHVDGYIQSLYQAITQSHAEYERIGVQVGGHYRQLSTALLQIENEFYSTIRPKRVTPSGHTPLSMLKQAGVEYVEVRCVDVNPYLPLGIDTDQVRFLDCLLLYCLLVPSFPGDKEDHQRVSHNMRQVVKQGRAPGLLLQSHDGEIALTQWGHQLLDGIEGVATLLDAACKTTDYQRVCRLQRHKLADPEATPSAQMLATMQSQSSTFTEFAMALTTQHKRHFKARPFSSAESEDFIARSRQSIEQQHRIEAKDIQNFAQYLQDYYAQYQALAI